MIGQIDDVHALRRRNKSAFVRKNIQLACAGMYFLQIGLELFDKRIIWRNRHNRHVLVNQSKRPVFEFACRIAFCVDISDFFEFKRTF